MLPVAEGTYIHRLGLNNELMTLMVLTCPKGISQMVALGSES